MSDSSNKTVIATFETREAADIAVEHLVQQLGIARTDVSVQAAGHENSSGLLPSGGDAQSKDQEGRADGKQDGEIEVSADVRAEQTAKLHRLFGDLGALRVSAK